MAKRKKRSQRRTRRDTTDTSEPTDWLLLTEYDRVSMVVYMAKFCQRRELEKPYWLAIQKKLNNAVVEILKKSPDFRIEDEDKTHQMILECNHAWKRAKRDVGMEYITNNTRELVSLQQKVRDLKEKAKHRYKEIYHVSTDLCQQDQQKFNQAFTEFEQEFLMMTAKFFFGMDRISSPLIEKSNIADINVFDNSVDFVVVTPRGSTTVHCSEELWQTQLDVKVGPNNELHQ